MENGEMDSNADCNSRRALALLAAGRSDWELTLFSSSRPDRPCANCQFQEIVLREIT